MFVFFKYQCDSTFTDNKSTPALIKRQGCLVGIFRSGKRLHIHKTCDSRRNNGGFGTAGNYGIRIPVTNKAHSFTDSIGTGSASRNSRHGRATAIVANGNHTGCHIADHHRYKQRRNTAGAFLHQLGVLRFKSTDATDTRTEYNGKAFGLNSTFDTAFVHCLLCCCNGKLCIAISTKHIINL